MNDTRYTPKSTNSVSNRRISLSFKLPLAVIGLLLIALTIYTFLSIRLSQQALLDTLRDELQDQATTKVEVLQSDLLVAKAIASQLAAFAETENVEESDLIQILRSTLRQNERVFGSTIAYDPYLFKPDTFYYAPYFNRQPNNTLIFTDLGTPEYDYFRKDWYALPKASRTYTISKPDFY